MSSQHLQAKVLVDDPSIGKIEDEDSVSSKTEKTNKRLSFIKAAVKLAQLNFEGLTAKSNQSRTYFGKSTLLGIAKTATTKLEKKFEFNSSTDSKNHL